MPILAQFIAALFTALSSFLLKLFVARVALRVAAVAAIAGFGTLLLAAFNAYVAPLAASLFSTSYGQLLGLIFPPIAGTVLAGLLALWAAALTYRLQVQAVKVTANL